jgi:hypothetical protein
MQVDRDLSMRLAEVLGKARPEHRITAEGARHSWHNAYRAALLMPHLVGDAVYVEGWAVVLATGQVFEHGWLEQAGRVVDPTSFDQDLAYFAGRRFTLGEAYTVRIKAAGSDIEEFPLTRHIGGLDIAEYRQAHEEARTFAESGGGGTYEGSAYNL